MSLKRAYVGKQTNKQSNFPILLKRRSINRTPVKFCLKSDTSRNAKRHSVQSLWSRLACSIFQSDQTKSQRQQISLWLTWAFGWCQANDALPALWFSVPRELSLSCSFVSNLVMLAGENIPTVQWGIRELIQWPKALASWGQEPKFLDPNSSLTYICLKLYIFDILK